MNPNASITSPDQATGGNPANQRPGKHYGAPQLPAIRVIRSFEQNLTP